MYKVFIYNKPIIFSDKTDESYENPETIVFPCNNIHERDFILDVLKKEPKSVIIKGENAFETIVEAAGGLVVNSEGKILFIYRRGFWDLPKGKIEKGEKKKVAAVREVEEECGINRPEIVEKITTTYHTYELKGRNILKPTYWYLMKYPGNEELVAQTEEDIAEAKWVAVDEIKEQLSNTYEAIKEVVEIYLQKEDVR